MSTDQPSIAADARIHRIDACLPQTQCRQCGYPRCRAYAEAVAHGDADIDQCPPGGDMTIAALAEFLGIAPKPLNTAYGRHQPRRRALIDEERCIGCRKCLDACPLGAIVGARRLMHTVIAADCSGCELCLPVCPVDCIAMRPVDCVTDGSGRWPAYRQAEVDRWRTLCDARLARQTERTQPCVPPDAPPISDPDRAQIRADIRAAVVRVRRRRALAPNTTVRNVRR